MSRGVISGLLFGIAGILAISACSLIPYVGPILCGPVGAALMGGIAGYVGVRWAGPGAGVGVGVLAGGMSGALMLIGTTLLFFAIFSWIQAQPESRQLLEEQMQRQLGGSDIEPEMFDTAMRLAPLAGVCFGIVNLLAAVAAAIGGALLARRGQTTNAAPPPPQPMEPPPLSPQ